MKAELVKRGVRVETDLRDEKLGYKIREAQMKKIPMTLVLGDKERDERAVNIRRYGQQEQVSASLDEFIASLTDEIANRSR